jgi:hypothetical protein
VDNRYLIRKVEFLVVSIQLQSTSNWYFSNLPLSWNSAHFPVLSWSYISCQNLLRWG